MHAREALKDKHQVRSQHFLAPVKIPELYLSISPIVTMSHVQKRTKNERKGQHMVFISSLPTLKLLDQKL